MLSDSQIAKICSQEIQSSSSEGGDLAEERAKALNYYLAEPYGDEAEGRSSVVTSEVRDTVQGILPSLMRIFRDPENLFEFDAVGPEDEDAAEQESDRVQYAWAKQNNAFFNVLSFCTDALLSKTGVLKCWWDEKPTNERAEYKNLSEMDLAELFSDEAVEREIVEFEQHEAGFDITFQEKRTNGKVRIEPVCPEDFGVNADARTPNAQDCDFVWHRVRKTKPQLLADGFKAADIDKIPRDEDQFGQENLARRHLSDEQGDQRSDEMRPYWVTECYLRLDVRENGESGMWKVTLATGANSAGSAGHVLDKEEVDSHPFFSATPVLMTHKFTGLSIADLVMAIQRIKSSILRNILDNQYFANNRRNAISNLVNLDDMLTNRPGGVARVDTDSPDVAGHITPIGQAAGSPETFPLLAYLDEMIQDRTGAGDNVAGLDATSLANVNSGVAALAFDQARSKIELIAELMAEIGFRPLFKRVHELLQKCQDKREVMKLRGKWIEVNPSEWRTRENMTINIGMGVSSRERKLIALDTIATKQQVIIEGGGLGTLLTPVHIYNGLMDHAEALGISGERYFMNPEDAPPQPQEPDAARDAMMLSAQAQMGSAQAQNDRNKVEMAKAQSAERIRIAEIEQAEREMQGRVELQRLQADLGVLKGEREQSDKAGKAMLDSEIKAREQELKAADIRLKDEQEASRREVDMFKALLASSTTLTQEQLKLAGVESQPVAQTMDTLVQAIVEAMAGEIGELRSQLIEQTESSRAPKLVKRDKNGLIISIGDRPVMRDASGLVESIG